MYMWSVCLSGFGVFVVLGYWGICEWLDYLSIYYTALPPSLASVLHIIILMYIIMCILLAYIQPAYPTLQDKGENFNDVPNETEL